MPLFPFEKICSINHKKCDFQQPVAEKTMRSVTN